MIKYKFAVQRTGEQLESLFRTLRKLPTNTKISDSVEEMIRSAVRDNSEEGTVYIFFNPNAIWSDDVLEYCFNTYYFMYDEETADYEWVQNVQAFITSDGLVFNSVTPVHSPDRFRNGIFHVNGEAESRAVLLRLKELGEITEGEYQSCFPSGDENRYLAHKTIFLTGGVVTFDTRKLMTHMDTSLPEPNIIDMEDFLAECAVRPHARLIREWLDDTTMQVEMQLVDGSWSIVHQPGWVPDCQYRRYVAEKSPVEEKVEGILAGLDEDERAELKRQLAVS